jgi:transposase
MTTKQLRFSPEFRQECTELVLSHGYSTREAAEAMGVGKSTLGKWVKLERKIQVRQSPIKYLLLQNKPKFVS